MHVYLWESVHGRGWGVGGGVGGVEGKSERGKAHASCCGNVPLLRERACESESGEVTQPCP